MCVTGMCVNVFFVCGLVCVCAGFFLCLSVFFFCVCLCVDVSDKAIYQIVTWKMECKAERKKKKNLNRKTEMEELKRYVERNE